jgi:hypothetical protein
MGRPVSSRPRIFRCLRDEQRSSGIVRVSFSDPASACSPPAGRAGRAASRLLVSLGPRCLLLRRGPRQIRTAPPAAGPRPAAGDWPAGVAVLGVQQVRPPLPERRQTTPVVVEAHRRVPGCWCPSSLARVRRTRGRRRLACAAVAGTTEADDPQGCGPVRSTRRGASSPRCAAPDGQHLGGESARSHGREHK